MLSNREDHYLITENAKIRPEKLNLLIYVRKRWLIKNMWYQSDPLLPINCSLFRYSPRRFLALNCVKKWKNRILVSHTLWSKITKFIFCIENKMKCRYKCIFLFKTLQTKKSMYYHKWLSCKFNGRRRQSIERIYI